jgi:hypothetical protein
MPERMLGHTKFNEDEPAERPGAGRSVDEGRRKTKTEKDASRPSLPRTEGKLRSKRNEWTTWLSSDSATQPVDLRLRHAATSRAAQIHQSFRRDPIRNRSSIGTRPLAVEKVRV